MRIGIYGGSFDPVHYGHLLLAESCREQRQLDEVFFVPAALSPHKTRQASSEGKYRVEMLRLAIGGHPDFDVKTWELDRGGVSYTVETLREVRMYFPTADVFLLMGADSLHDFPNWREPKAICQLATIVVVDRPGSPHVSLAPLSGLVDEEKGKKLENLRVQMPQIDLSSSDLRDRVAAGKSIRFRTPRSVEAYIETQGLYKILAQS
jgi:nicotinate-nucleotide adenylyltransferase